MLAKKNKGFVSLKRPPMKAEKGMSVEEYRYPSLYVDNIPLPVTEEDLNNVLTAEVKVKVKRVSMNVTNGKETKSYEFDIQGIRFM